MHTEGSAALSDKIGTQRHLLCARPQRDFSGRYAWLRFCIRSGGGTGFSPAKFLAGSSGGGRTSRAWEIHIFACFCVACCCRLSAVIFVSLERNKASGRADSASRRDSRQAPAAVTNEQQYAYSMTHTHLIQTSLRTYLGSNQSPGHNI
jgi:hypothetical protein